MKSILFRTTMRIHGLVQYIQARVEMDLRVWKYLLPPGDEKDGHEIMGSMPVWQLIQQTDHYICQTGSMNTNNVVFISILFICR